MLVMQLFTAEVAIMFKKIQGLSTINKQQRADLDAIVLTHMDKIDCIGPLTDHELDTLSNNIHVKNVLFSVYIASVREFLMRMDYWVDKVVTYLE